MSRLPHNVERVREPYSTSYRFRAYSKDGYALRLYNEGGVTPWALYDFRQGGNNAGDRPHAKGKYLGRRRTLELIGALAATITIGRE